ncbi:hypothetical protein V8Z69_07555 [Microbacterium aurugineum]|uniref:hypothetical protein n=1 Tax=Microbacterium aurugineum TaxID=2851642 RepID=UPI0039BDD8A6
MTIETHNPDRKYEMMAEILPREGQNLPDAEQIIDDLREILVRCYMYTIGRDTVKEHTAGTLADSIVNYLFASWTGREHDFEQYAKEIWGLSELDVESTTEDAAGA